MSTALALDLLAISPEPARPIVALLTRIVPTYLENQFALPTPRTQTTAVLSDLFSTPTPTVDRHTSPAASPEHVQLYKDRLQRTIHAGCRMDIVNLAGEPKLLQHRARLAQN